MTLTVHYAPGRVLLSWDAALGPTWSKAQEGNNPERKKYLRTCEVWRCANAVDGRAPAVKLGESEAEAWFDTDVPNEAHLSYWVLEQTATGLRQIGPTVDVVMPQASSGDHLSRADVTPPSAPQDLVAWVIPASTVPGSYPIGNLLEWSPSADAESGLLAYLLYDSNQDQPDSVIWANIEAGEKVAEFLDRSPDTGKGYELAAIDVALNLSDRVGPVKPQPSGWTAYEFLVDSAFELKPHKKVRADVLLVGGGGSGGGGFQGGGGGGGGFLDVHDFVIDSDVTPGTVTVGAGGAAPDLLGTGANGGESSYADMRAYGGGFGSSEWYDWDKGHSVVVDATDGASGGGGSPWGKWIGGNPGQAQHYEGPGGKATHGDQGHDGTDGNGWTAWVNHTAGSGGGANWPGYQPNSDIGPVGGLGRPCDILGWGPFFAESGLRFISWYAGGGGGCERPNNWGYPGGLGGYGGGGDPGNPGVDGLGGGAGGNGAMGPGHNGDAPGTKGGDGCVVIRIPTHDVRWVTYPLPIGRDENGDDVYPDGIHVVKIPMDQPHLDEMGSEPVVVWQSTPAGGDHHGWDGTFEPGDF